MNGGAKGLEAAFQHKFVKHNEGEYVSGDSQEQTA